MYGDCVCMRYGVASISRLLKMTGLFCKRTLYKRLYSAKETYNFMEPTSCSHPIVVCERVKFHRNLYVRERQSR